MKNYSIKSLVILGAILLVTGIAFAHGRGYHMGGYGGGYHMNGGYGMMNGSPHGWDNLSAEDQKKMQDEMNAFYEETKALRAEYSQKRAALAQEYATPEKDQAAIDHLEEELFNLSSKLDKERFDHMGTMRKQFGGNTYGMGYGHGCF